MDLSEKVLGTSVATSLRERAARKVFTVGATALTKAKLAEAGCFNFTAAVSASAIIARELKVTDLRDLYEHVPPSALALPGLGAVSLAVLGAAFEAVGIGGDTPLENWVKKHLAQGQSMVTFGTLKHRDEAEQRAEHARWKARKHARRDQAHQARVSRFSKRQGRVAS